MEKSYEINELATEYYHQKLLESKEAQEYLRKRKINNESIALFQIGYAPKENELYEYLLKKGYNEELIKNSSLIIEDTIDKFSNRIVFPNIDEKKRVTSFSARTINDNTKPKYINSTIHMKTQNLYGINLPKDCMEKYIVLVEGATDVITLNQAEIKNVVALLGTELTEEQCNLIKRITNTVIVALDNDLAGKNATKRIIKTLNKFDIKSKILNIEKAKDPDEYIKNFGINNFKELIDNAILKI